MGYEFVFSAYKRSCIWEGEVKQFNGALICISETAGMAQLSTKSLRAGTSEVIRSVVKWRKESQ
jgi:hypothetical protein